MKDYTNTISRADFSRFRNHEHFQYQKELNILLNQINPVKLRIESLAEQHAILFNKEDEALMKIIKNTFSEAKSEIDNERNRIFRGLSDVIKAGLNHYELELRNNAVRIKIPMKTYGNVCKMPRNEETSAIYNLINELRDNFLDDVIALNLAPWLDTLEACNSRYEEFVRISYDEDIAKTELKMKEVRTNIDVVVRQLLNRVESLMMVDWKDDYIDFVKRLNIMTDKYNVIIAQRQGRNAAKDNEN